jgi:uncharacterized BrkB/YihY/UPF0761 family membrane protein
MAVTLVIRTVGAVLAIGMAIYITLPIMYQLKNIDAWNVVPAEGITIRDNVYTIFLALAIPLIGMVFLWGFMSATRRQPDEF